MSILYLITLYNSYIRFHKTKLKHFKFQFNLSVAIQTLLALALFSLYLSDNNFLKKSKRENQTRHHPFIKYNNAFSCHCPFPDLDASAKILFLDWMKRRDVVPTQHSISLTFKLLSKRCSNNFLQRISLTMFVLVKLKSVFT